MACRDDRFLDFVVPLSQTSDGTVDDFHVAMVDIGGESPGEVADEESPAIASCRTRIDTVNGRGGIVDKGFDLLPLLLETLFFGLGRFGSLANRFECTFSPFPERRDALGVAVAGLFVAARVEACRSRNHRAGTTAVGGDHGRKIAFVVFHVTFPLPLGHRLQIPVQFLFVRGDV